jgi:predicted RNA-binding Zn-ribbon protein involved in translation (DUF1610 family)
MTEQPIYATCPRCGEDRLRVSGDGARNALSRKDNKTYVCSPCGTDEGMRARFEHIDVWPSFPNVMEVDG